MTTFSKSEKDDRTVDAGVRTSAGGHASRKSLKSGRIRAYKLAKNNNNNNNTNKTDKSKNAKSKGFWMSTPTKWIDFIFFLTKVVTS